MKKSFLATWIGGINSFGMPEKFVGGKDHSSLSDEENDFVESGGIVLHKKGPRDTKIFLMDEEGTRYSAIVRDSKLKGLLKELAGVGYLLPATK
ncbi:hypothetical protein J6T66_03015 [bacterium]|nr:hypothetical protein [bacterium]